MCYWPPHRRQRILFEDDCEVILVIDNYDSFTYNLVQYLGELGAETQVVRNDSIDIGAIDDLRPQRILISPGPGTPDSAGISLAVIERFAKQIPILGVCLGHQAIAQAFGGTIGHAKRIMHGKTSEIHHTGAGLFAGIGSPFRATRYHSLVIKEDSLPECLEMNAWTEVDNHQREEIMGVRHRSYPTVGVQFHPESILTEHGHKLLKNFLEYAI